MVLRMRDWRASKRRSRLVCGWDRARLVLRRQEWSSADGEVHPWESFTKHDGWSVGVGAGGDGQGQNAAALLEEAREGGRLAGGPARQRLRVLMADTWDLVRSLSLLSLEEGTSPSFVLHTALQVLGRITFLLLPCRYLCFLFICLFYLSLFVICLCLCPFSSWKPQ